MTTFTRQQLDHWVQGMADRLKPEAETALAGDLAEIVAGEVEVIEHRVAAEDRDYFHDQVQDVLEALKCIRASHPDE
ncbi:hypothetical protein ATCM_12420 [Stenotrophomonas sp. ATCM1_4]|uniref:hypothetical protein n=1 Tax=Stenotrophomonas sp. ATCM1_4 TaxID=2259330 RepID=UPI0010526F0D|nr:hypothetical protein [Stenotrophomonas sp. ATCM1_4]TDB28396.1 hypothetical protein ATCM_12420 [Stenotrophomonas sp. ATCM1_4]